MARGGASGGTPGDVGEFTMLKSQPGSEDALMILKKIHSLAKPIMKKHSWYLPRLAEFFPSQTNLLGINCNGGQKICLRLRPAHSPSTFYDEEHLIGTMLHELTHNVRGPHDQIFYKQLDALQDEYDALRASGYSGEGFLGNGNRVGLGVSHDLPPDQARKLALMKLEEKERVRRLLGTGGKLGGEKPDTRGKRIGDILADAAERRIRDSKSCGGGESHDHASGSKQEDLPASVQKEIELAEADSEVHVVDLTGSDNEDDAATLVKGKSRGKSRLLDRKRSLPSPPPEDDEDDSDVEIIIPVKRPSSTLPPSLPPPTKKSSLLPSSSTNSNPTSASSKVLPKATTIPKPTPSSSKTKASAASTKPKLTEAPQNFTWSCPACTFENISALSLACELCLTERPASITSSLAAKAPRGGASSALAKPPPPQKQPTWATDGWVCHVCGTISDHLFSTCRTCATVKTSSKRLD